VLATEAIKLAGSDAQKKKWLPALASGQAIGTLAVSEGPQPPRPRTIRTTYGNGRLNGKKVPGAGDDRSFYVDRIPAEMVDHIEIKRSASANRSGDAMAGAINIVLRDAYEFTGSYIRVGVNRWDDGEINPTFGAVTSFEALGGRLLAGVNVQDRYRAKTKRSDRFTDSTREEKVSWEDQTEVKDGRDYSANLSYTADVGDTGRFSIDRFYVKTDRDVTEVSFERELDDGETVNDRVPGRGHHHP